MTTFSWGHIFYAETRGGETALERQYADTRFDSIAGEIDGALSVGDTFTLTTVSDSDNDPDTPPVVTTATATFEGNAADGGIYVAADLSDAWKHYVDREATYLLTDTRYDQNGTVAPANEGGEFMCLTAGTRIATPAGMRPVDDLAPGDAVLTFDGRAVPIRFLASNPVAAARIEADPSLAPVRIRAGALGGGRPHADLVVSRQHKILLSGARARLLFDAPSVLVAAESLLDGTRVTEEPPADVVYFVIACDRHEAILAEGAAVDTLYLAPDAVEDLAHRAEIDKIFPGLLDAPRGAYGPPAARILADVEARTLAVFARR